MIRRTIFALGALLSLSAAAQSAPAPTAADPAAAARIRAHVEFLADDLLEGRDTGSRGYDIAATYVASQFRAIGLKPAGENGSWFQQVPFRRSRHVTPPKIMVTVGNKTFPLTSGVDAGLAASLSERRSAVDAGLVFVGHGISESRMKIDEYRGLDVRGKIVVVLPGSPEGLPTEVAAHLESSKSEFAEAHGAVGIITLPGGRFGANGRVRQFSQPTDGWIDKAGRAPSSSDLRIQMAVTPSAAEHLFAGSRRSFSAIRAQGGNKSVKGFPLVSRLVVEATDTWEDFKSPEVVGLLPGSDPALAREYVVLMGHLDHLGIKKDAKAGEDAIRNGALDNAAGVATMLEAAREFVESGKPPRRSVLFIANTGEEKGLLGADFYAAHPTVPIQQIVSVVDLDMPLLLYDFTDIVAFGADHSTVAQNVEQAAQSMGISMSVDPMPEESIFTRSDHYQFVKRGVPAILLFTGYANGGKQYWDKWLPTIYHTPQDDLTQAINWNAGARYAQLNYRISRALADADTRPLWYEGDYFGDVFASGQPRAKR